MKKILIVFCLFFANIALAQQTDDVDFKKIQATINLLPDSSKVKGGVYCEFKILRDLDSVYLNAVDMSFDFFKEHQNDIKFSYDGKKLWLKSKFKEAKHYAIAFKYEVKPKKALYFLEKNGAQNIWTQGQGKYTSHWLPSIDDVNDKIEFDLSITHDKDYEVIANGNIINKQLNDSIITWQYNMQNPMSSYLVAVAIGKYNKKNETSKRGIPLEYYYYPEDSLKVEPTYRYSKRMFDFLEEEIGFGYPWQNYKQVPVHDFLYAGMENTSCTIFSDAFVVDSIGFNDKNYVNVNAHELAHQWFGNLVTAKSGEHHWLQEGFATYYALLAERDVFGDNYYHFRLFESAQNLNQQDVAGNGTSLLNPKSSSLTFYHRGAWVLHALRDKIGDKTFKKAVKLYLKQYKFTTADTSDFISIVEKASGKDLTGFFNLWIVQKEFPLDDAMDVLKRQSFFIQEYLMVDCEAKTSKCTEFLTYDISDEAKAKIIGQVPSLVDTSTFKNSLKVRQAISKYVTKIPLELKTDYESLLDDKSYVTVETALYNLWVNFPSERTKYLNKTKSIIGFTDKNVRLLWLVLSLNTPEYEPEKNEAYYRELLGYTHESNNFELRIKAFEYLYVMGVCDADCQNNLKKGLEHHNWRMVKFSKDMLKKMGI